MNKLDYDSRFYELQNRDNMSSAEVIVPIALDYIGLDPQKMSVIDIGCGSGNWLSVFKKYGCKILGVDGGANADDIVISPSEFVSHDFRVPYNSDCKYDMAISLECAEHIPEEQAELFVDMLVQLSDCVLFSAAIPHQRGRNHINEQYQSYWIEKFEKRNYAYVDAIRSKVWDNEKVRAFYAQNIFLYINRESDFFKTNKLEIEKINSSKMTNIIHPGIWEDINNYKIVKYMDYLHSVPPFAWFYYKFVKKYMRFN